VVQKLHDDYGFSFNYVGVLLGGWNGWKAAGYPTETGDSAAIPTEGAASQPLRYGLSAAPSTLDPQLMRSIDEISLGQLVFEGLLVLNADNQPVPGAAATMDVSADGLKYTLTLRDGLTYSDGTPLTAHDFDYAWHRAFDPRVGFHPYSSVAYDIVGVEELANADAADTAKVTDLLNKLGIKALDDSHIEFTLKQRAAYFPYILTLWIGWPSRQDLVEKGGTNWDSNNAGTYYVGNGPYVVKSYDPARGMQLTGNPAYRNGAPQVGDLDISFLNNAAGALQAYQRGEVDVLRLTGDNYEAATRDQSLKDQLVTLPGSCTDYFIFNTRQPPFDNLAVRQAFAQALDRADYVETQEHGLAQPAQSLIPPDHAGHAPDLALWPFDPAKARHALAEAGYPDGKGLPPIKLTYTPAMKARMEWLQRQLRTNLGVNVELNLVEADAYNQLFQSADTVPLIYTDGWCEDYPDPQDWLSFVFRSDSTVGRTLWQDADFDQLTHQADAEEDPAKRQQLYHQAQEILVRNVPVMFLTWTQDAVLIRPYVQNMREYINSRDLVGVPGFFNLLNITVAPH
jgi:oligopeptide transport system substrate-binding protein